MTWTEQATTQCHQVRIGCQKTGNEKVEFWKKMEREMSDFTQDNGHMKKLSLCHHLQRGVCTFSSTAGLTQSWRATPHFPCARPRKTDEKWRKLSQKQEEEAAQ